MNALTEKALELVVSQIGVREVRKNRGPEIDAYQIAAGLSPEKAPGGTGYPWCCCLMFWAFGQASLSLRIPNPMPRTASVMKLWTQTPPWRKGRAAPGAIFIIDHGSGRGHCGMVEHAGGSHHVTIEGNTDGSGGREGDGVYRRFRRPDEITGYIDYALAMPDLVA